MTRAGVLLMAHGTPSSLDEMPEYLRLVRGGRPPSDRARRRDAPQLRGDWRTLAADRHHDAQAGRCGRGSDRTCRSPSACATGSRSSRTRSPSWRRRRHARHRHPAGAAVLHAERAEVHRRRDGGAARGLQFDAVDVVSRASAAARGVRRARACRAPAAGRAGRVHRAQPAAARRSTPAIATPTKSPRRPAAWPSAPASPGSSIAYQSAGRTPEPWIGPDLGAPDRRARRPASARFLVVPIGFVCDHTEILFDIDVQARASRARVRDDRCAGRSR